MRTLFVLFIFIAGTAAECCQKRRVIIVRITILTIVIV